MKFQLTAPFQPTGDQPQAIEKLIKGIEENRRHQVLLGVTGSGKTFSLANVIAKTQKPALVISHNKTLAAQLYQEFRDFFPHNAVSYFVSYYDFYQPEAYIPRTDTYIEKETEINEEIDKLRLAATTNLLTRSDTIIVASVSCIYNIGSPEQYSHSILPLEVGSKSSRESIFTKLIDLAYNRSPLELKRGTFRARGETLDIFPAYGDTAIRVLYDTARIEKIVTLDPVSGIEGEEFSSYTIYPAKHYIADRSHLANVFSQIRDDLDTQLQVLKKEGKELEAHRLHQRVNFDLEMIQEVGYVNGIENYSRYFDGRREGDAPYTLLDYFRYRYGNDWILCVDESHMTIPQIRGMYRGDRSRKQTLVNFGFRLPAALDNRPLTFPEFLSRQPVTIYVSATPDEWEVSYAKESGEDAIVEQLIRPTGIIDPAVSVRPTKNQIVDLVQEIIVRKEAGERVLVTTLTKRMAEELTRYLIERQYRDLPEFAQKSNLPDLRIQYLHSDIQTLERSDILDDLRTGQYDVLIGINLLREGLDLPEVSLVAILDADKEGFLRSTTSLIQTMGRAARHIHGMVVLYADEETGSMKRAIAEIRRRRTIQMAYNTRHNISPQGIVKPIREKLVLRQKQEQHGVQFLFDKKRKEYKTLRSLDTQGLTPMDAKRLVKLLEREMKEAAGMLNFELAAEIRDKAVAMKKEYHL